MTEIYLGKGRYRINKRRPIEERFWEKVNKSGPIPPHCPELGNCWVWTAATNNMGYGVFNNNQRIMLSHHFPLGEIPAGMDVCHKCDNTRCVRPDHTFFGTHKENMQDSIRKGRLNPIGLMQPGTGECHPSHKLTQADVDFIRSMPYFRGLDGQMAEKFGIHRVHAGDIRRGKKWSSGSQPARLIHQPPANTNKSFTKSNPYALRQAAMAGMSQGSMF